MTQLRLAAVGDISLGDHLLTLGFGVRSTIARRGAEHIFARVAAAAARRGHRLWKPRVRRVAEAGRDPARPLTDTFRATEDAVRALAAGGFNIVNVANNHSPAIRRRRIRRHAAGARTRGNRGRRSRQRSGNTICSASHPHRAGYPRWACWPIRRPPRISSPASRHTQDGTRRACTATSRALRRAGGFRRGLLSLGCRTDRLRAPRRGAFGALDHRRWCRSCARPSLAHLPERRELSVTASFATAWAISCSTPLWEKFSSVSALVEITLEKTGGAKRMTHRGRTGAYQRALSAGALRRRPGALPGTLRRNPAQAARVRRRRPGGG